MLFFKSERSFLGVLGFELWLQLPFLKVIHVDSKRQEERNPSVETANL